MTVAQALLLIIVLLAAIDDPRAVAAPVPICAGDCAGDGVVAIEEVVLGVRIALGEALVAQCAAADRDADGTVAIDELLGAVANLLQGCASTPTPTTAPATPTATPVSTPGAELMAAGRVATDPLRRLLDVQESVGTAVVVAARARRAATDPSPIGADCQELDCSLGGTLIVCCAGTTISQTFDRCAFDDTDGVGSLSGQFTLEIQSATACAGAIPLGESFTAVLDGFTYDVARAAGGFRRTVQQLSERHELGSGACTLSPPDFFGFGVRGIGRRHIDGVLQRFETDAAGGLVADTRTRFDGVVIDVGAIERTAGCDPTAAFAGTITDADFRRGTALAVDVGGLTVAQRFVGDAVELDVSGGVAADCTGEVTVDTDEDLRLTPGAPCFTAGRLRAQTAAGVVAAAYSSGGGVALDVGADGSVEHQATSCREAPLGPCRSTTVGLCAACGAAGQCHVGLGCLPCADDCSGDTDRCALFDTFVTCSDGRF